MASVYLDSGLPVVPPWLTELLEYSKDNEYGIVIGMDSNAHSQMYGPTTNARGLELEGLIFQHDLTIENIGQEPTFSNANGQSCIDVTLTRDLPVGGIDNWRVRLQYNGSDHRTIRYSIQLGFEYIEPTRPWAKADWEVFKKALRKEDIYIPTTMTQKKFDKLVDKMNDAINTALNKACPLTPGHHRDRNNPWYTEWMEVLRRRLERHYQKQRINPSPTNTQRFKTTQKTYKRECRKRKRRSSRQHIEWTPDSRTASKLLKSLSPGGRPGVSSFEKQDGTFILPGEETATHVLESHFPESEPAFYPHYTHKHIDMDDIVTVSYTHLRAHETPEHLVCRLLLEKKK